MPFYQWHDAYPVPTVDTNVGVSMDSLFAPYNNDSLVVRQSLFTGHTLIPHSTTLNERPQTTAPAWVFAVVVLLCALQCLVFRTRKIKIGELLKSIIDPHGIDRMLHTLSTSHVSLVPVAFILTAALAMGVWSMFMQHTGIVGYLLLAFGLAFGYLLRNGILHFLASVFDCSQTMTSYIGGNYLYHMILGSVVTPMLFVVVYIPAAAPVTAIVAGVLAAIVFLFRFARGVQLFLTKTKSVSLFLFYYLCIVEMIPALVLLKWIISQ